MPDLRVRQSSFRHACSRIGVGLSTQAETLRVRGRGSEADGQTEVVGQSEAQTEAVGQSEAQTEVVGQSEAQTEVVGQSEAQTEAVGQSEAQTEVVGQSEATGWSGDARGRAARRFNGISQSLFLGHFL